MEHYVTVVMEKQETKTLDESAFPIYETFESEQDTTVMQIPLPRTLDEQESGEYANNLANYLFSEGYEDFDIFVNAHESEDLDEVTFDDDDDFYAEYGEMWYNDDDVIDEEEYQGRKVKLGKPMQGDTKKFKVYVKNPKGNVVKVNLSVLKRTTQQQDAHLEQDITVIIQVHVIRHVTGHVGSGKL
jgi:hypothetical protein